ncbi:hypothetical protein QY049_03915 [Bradyrhizobium sp. WYCCWR 13022]|uniref:hypothetical protein n=1 Tax=unclassified Bradyrhizobium TaxID=2631580 RepID=UPI00263A7C49|nr:hypothetical protein [Bradyrhizobium sp. WYCCWR 13022]MDN4982369.1 hypothetical protein [Bradyrhizobium sp. WYCCWR 13022]
MSTTTYIERKHAMQAAFVVYHRDHGRSCSVWMVPGTHVEQPGKPYRSAALEAADTFSAERQHERQMEARRDRAMKRIDRGRTATYVPRYRSGEHSHGR